MSMSQKYKKRLKKKKVQSCNRATKYSNRTVFRLCTVVHLYAYQIKISKKKKPQSEIPKRHQKDNKIQASIIGVKMTVVNLLF